MKQQSKHKEWAQIGVIGVDAGICWIGDPCYIREGEEPLKNWDKFCSLIETAGIDTKGYAQINFEMGHAGKGVVVRTGHGDGCYPVMAWIEKGVVKEVRIIFTD